MIHNTKRERTFIGTVVKQLVAVGSKSEREAYLLETGIGPLFIRRKNGNAFQDDELDKIVGMKIIAKGILSQKLFILDEWDEWK